MPVHLVAFSFRKSTFNKLFQLSNKLYSNPVS